MFATDVQAEALADVAGPIGVVAVPGDVREPEDVQRVIHAALAANQPIDVFANVAGVIVFKPVEATTVEYWDQIDVNLKGSFLFCCAGDEGGAIINTSSNAGVHGGVDESAYCASKLGIEGLS